MKVLNYTTSYFAILLLIIIPVWAGLFYYAMLDEIYDSIDDGLDNQKQLIIQKAAIDSSILRKNNFEEAGYAITEINPQAAIHFYDVYMDTTMYMQNEKDFEPVRLLKTVFHHNGKYYQMQVATSMIEEDDLSAALLYALLWLYLGLVATILILNNVLLQRIWKPFYHLLEQIKAFQLEKPLPLAVAATRIEEFKLLNEAIQKLLQSNMDAYAGQKQFIENASHELQTPLAISINKLEMLAETSTLSEEELKLLASALGNLERLTRLNRSLLLLSRIENKQFPAEEEININALLKKIRDDFSEQLSYSKLVLHIEEQGAAVIKMNPDLAAVLFTNLVKNAVVHNHPDGFIHVLITTAFVQIENTGRAEALDSQKLFSRFYKEQQSPTSTGLGLAIVKAIADLYAFTVTYTYSNRHRLTVSFR